MPRCRDCSQTFPGEKWKTRCKTCFIEHKRAEERAERGADAYGAGYAAGYRAGLSLRVAPAAGPLPVDVDELVQLCHPDRHPPERFALANRITSELLNGRNR